MNRRRFAFWLGMGLFGAAERLGAAELDKLAAVLMDATGDGPPSAPAAEAIATTEAAAAESTAAAAESIMPVHWQATHNRTWRWVQREEYVDGEWRLTGMTTPRRLDSGEPVDQAEGYLNDDDVPESFRTAYDDLVDANGDPIAPKNDHGISADDDAPGPDAAPHRKARHGRPPSRWLRSLDSAELSVWLASIEPPEAGVNGMTFEHHLTRDHQFAPERIAGLTEDELAKLHGAAHGGY